MAGEVKTDVVSENTTATGVTVDSLLIKDGDMPNLAYCKTVAAGYKLARGITAVTGTLNITTGLTTVVIAGGTLESDVSLGANTVSVTGGSSAGKILVKVWKPTATSDCTPVAATSAFNVGWIAVGT